MDINKYTQKSQEAIIKAQRFAVERHHQEVTSRHLTYIHSCFKKTVLSLALYKNPDLTSIRLNPLPKTYCSVFLGSRL
jgi:hypothetical protein